MMGTPSLMMDVQAAYLTLAINAQELHARHYVGILT